jgi:uncharacterized MnhB-related membrane protein
VLIPRTAFEDAVLLGLVLEAPDVRLADAVVAD